MGEVEEPLTEASFRASGASRRGSPAPRNVPSPAPPPVSDNADEAERPVRRSAATHTAFTASLRQQAPSAAARWGWRGRIRRWTGGRFSPAVSPAEQRWNAALRAVQMTFGEPRTIAFVNPKGGAFKTTATLMAARTFGVHRGGGVVAIDGNETRGTLGERALPAAHGNTVRQLAATLELFEEADAEADAAASLNDLGQYVRGQGPAHFDVLASDERPDLTGVFDGRAFQRLHALLRRHYRLVLVDTGNNPQSPNWLAAVHRADLVVITTTVREDAASAALWTADFAERHVVEAGALRKRGVTLVCDPGPGLDPGLRSFLVETFAERCRAVMPIPYEPALAGGGQLDYTRLSPATHTAWLYACAAMASALSPGGEEQERQGSHASR